MSLPKETIEQLARVSRLDAEELAAAITAEEEKALEIPDVKTYTDDELTTRVSNELRGVIDRYSQKELGGVTITGDTPDDVVHALGKRVYEDSKTAATEMFVKKYKESNGLDFHGKSLEDLISYVKSQKQDTGELEGTIEQLRKNLTTKDEELEKIKNDYEKRLNGATINQSVLAAIPDTLIEHINKNDVQQLFLSTHEAEFKDGGIIVKKNGEVIKDAQLLNPLPLERVVQQFVEERGWLSNGRQGRGGTDQKGKVTGLEHIHDQESFFGYLKDKGIQRASRDAVVALEKLPKEVQEKILAES